MFWSGFFKSAASSGATYKKDDVNPQSYYEEEQHIVGPKPHDEGSPGLKGSAKIDGDPDDPNLEAQWGGKKSFLSYTGGITGHQGAY